MRISDAEWTALEAIWELGVAGAAEVIQIVQPRTGWHHRTIRTLLNRLAQKGALTVLKQGGRNVYRPAVSREDCVREASRSFLEKMFRGNIQDLLAHFAQQEGMTVEALDRLKSLLDGDGSDGSPQV